MYFCRQMSEKFSITIMTDPMVWRFLQNSVRQSDGALEMPGTPWYGLVTSILSRSTVRLPSKMRRAKYNRFLPCRVWITEHDFFHYGWQTNQYQEHRFNMIMKRWICDEMLRRVAALRSCSDIAIAKAIEHYMISYGFSDEEMNPESMRKAYIRNYRTVEKEYKNFAREACEEAGATMKPIHAILPQPPSKSVYRHRKIYTHRKIKDEYQLKLEL